MPHMTIEQMIAFIEKFQREYKFDFADEGRDASSTLKRMQDVKLPDEIEPFYARWSIGEGFKALGLVVGESDHANFRQSPTAQIAALKEKLHEVEELHRMQMAGISTASSQNTRESLKQRIEKGHPYWTPAYGDMCVTVDREIFERERAEKSEAENAKLTERLREAEKDNERLDAIESMWPNGIHIESCATGNMSIGIKRTCTVFTSNNEYRDKTIRAAIDAALSARDKQN